MTAAEEPPDRERRFRALTRMDDMVVWPYVYTSDEFKKLIEGRDPLALRIVSEGKILYEQQ